MQARELPGRPGGRVPEQNVMSQYRTVGHPIACAVREVLVDRAEAVGLDPLEIAAVLSDGLAAVEHARGEALCQGVHSADVILNILARRREAAPLTIVSESDSVAARAGRRMCPVARPQDSLVMERSAVLAAMGELKLYGMKAAFDDIMVSAVKRQYELQRIVAEC